MQTAKLQNYKIVTQQFCKTTNDKTTKPKYSNSTTSQICKILNPINCKNEKEQWHKRAKVQKHKGAKSKKPKTSNPQPQNLSSLICNTTNLQNYVTIQL